MEFIWNFFMLLLFVGLAIAIAMALGDFDTISYNGWGNTNHWIKLRWALLTIINIAVLALLMTIF